jgi:DNA-binding NtrC family response regulator
MTDSQRPRALASSELKSTALPIVVVVDPDPATSRPLVDALRAAQCEVHAPLDLSAAEKRIAAGDVDVVLLEESLSRDGPIAEVLRRVTSPPAVVILSPFGTVEGAVHAMRAGAVHYAAKPVSPEEILLAVERATAERRLRQENRELRGELERRASLGSLVVRDAKMREIFRLLETVAQTRATVLLLGESGTGKSVLARAIHHISPRRAGPFIEVNCGALPDTLLESELFGHAKGAFTGAHRDRPGRFEAASGGTIFLDEIGNASPSLQLRFLRVLQERVVERVGEERSRNVDVRVILATNHNLEEAVRKGTFREDLYYRIHVVAIDLPPLRERPSDIPELANYFLARASATIGRRVASIEPRAMDHLVSHRWPGNVRELENAIERGVAVGRGEILAAADLPPEVRGNPPASEAAARARSEVAGLTLDAIPLGPVEGMLEICERRFIERALDASSDNRTRAAALLGLHRATLYQRMHRVGLPTSGRP